jgi:hypothetical protein
VVQDRRRHAAGERPAELNQRMIESGKVEACLSANYFRYACAAIRPATARIPA